jgi:uncharacterized protein with HEPN domain
MLPRSPKLLWDIQDSAAFILEATDGKTFDDFIGTKMLRLAVERQFEIVGEASRRLRDYDPETAEALPGIHEAIGVRNIIAHEYDELDYTILWRTIQGPLRTLERAAAELLEEIGPPGTSN